MFPLSPDGSGQDCWVCGEPIADRGHALCHNCHRPFHLRQQEGGNGADCGEVWVNDQYLAMEFLCFICLGKQGEPGGIEPPLATSH